MTRLNSIRGATLLALTLGTLTLSAPANAVSQPPPPTCKTPYFTLSVEGTYAAPVLVAVDWLLCTNGNLVPNPNGYAQIGRYLIDGTYQAVTEMGQPEEEYACKGTTTYYEYTDGVNEIYIGCG
jgi:hypothetical protein